MRRIFVPTTGPNDWKWLLADPETQWVPGYSAKELAECWERAVGFPQEISRLFLESGISSFRKVELLLAFPEFQVKLPGGRKASQNDLFILAKDLGGNLIAITVEGKVQEPFGETLDEWLKDSSEGKKKRLEFIIKKLGLSEELPSHIRYQLLHRTASAVIEANRFNAMKAVMIVHSFSQDYQWFDDYQRFCELFGAQGLKDKLVFLKQTQGVELYCGWAKGIATAKTDA
jgi:hypothetical protein